MKLSLPSFIKPSKTWVVLGVALLIGVIAALGARTYLSKQMAAIEARSKVKSLSVVVAKRALKKGEALSSNNLAVRDIPEQYAHSGAVAPDDFERIDGQVLAYSVEPGEMILWGLMQSKRTPTFSSRVGLGRRAITVHVDEINSISGMLEPSDTVDLIATIEINNKKTTFPLLQGVHVMATGQRSVDDPKSGERRQYSTVTLDTTFEQAKTVIIAREAGKITALLRNPQDNKVFAGDSKAMAALLGLNNNVETLAAQAKTDGIPVLYGGGNAKFSPEALRLGGAAANAAPIEEQESEAPAAAAATLAAPPLSAATSTPP